MVSLLSWERGLKYGKTVDKLFLYDVAPLVGAWIEIVSDSDGGYSKPSLLSWERGLKYAVKFVIAWVTMSLLSWERGLK